MLSKLYDNPRGRFTRWFTFENPEGKKGAGATKNRGMKGAPCDTLHPGDSVVLAHYEGAGIINALWFALDSFNKAEGINALKIEFFWEGCEKPAVSAPVEEFFCHAVSTTKNPFENYLFSSPEGRSYNCFIPMPFKKECKVVLTNTSESLDIVVFYCLQMTCGIEPEADHLYFHSIYNPVKRNKLLEDHEILPLVTGRGRYLGCNVQMHAGESGYNGTWFGEGEFKFYLDGDREYPTLAGTGTEDYILTSYGQDVYSTLRAGCVLCYKDDNGCVHAAFHRVHVEDPVYFDTDCRITLQQIGGGTPEFVNKAIASGAPVLPISTALENGDTLWGDEAVTDRPDAKWINFMREDYVSSVAYFYLDRPEL